LRGEGTSDLVNVLKGEGSSTLEGVLKGKRSSALVGVLKGEGTLAWTMEQERHQNRPQNHLI
jgi:hypothetical protein